MWWLELCHFENNIWNAIEMLMMENKHFDSFKSG